MQLFWTEICILVSIKLAASLGPVPITDIQTPAALRNGHIYMKDALSDETIEKSIFRLLFFELW